MCTPVPTNAPLPLCNSFIDRKSDIFKLIMKPAANASCQNPRRLLLGGVKLSHSLQTYKKILVYNIINGNPGRENRRRADASVWFGSIKAARNSCTCLHSWGRKSRFSGSVAAGSQRLTEEASSQGRLTQEANSRALTPVRKGSCVLVSSSLSRGGTRGRPGGQTADGWRLPPPAAWIVTST